MLFNSSIFVVFCLAFFPLYYAISFPRQNLLLLAASLLFYGAWDWRFLGLLLGTSLLDFYCAKKIAQEPANKRRRFYLKLSIIANLSALGFFKYYNFFISELQLLFQELLGLTLEPKMLSIVLPVGLSFYTFQTMGYTIDVYRRKIAPEENFLTFALYVSFFPQLVAGPIERANNLLPQLRTPRRITVKHIQEGGWLLLLGFYKKLFVADNLAPHIQNMLASEEALSWISLTVLCYMIITQIYCDFSGYTDIARGLAKLMGIDLMVNFRFPLFAKNPRDFWQRWHISLSEWLRDYLYIPLGGNIGSSWRRFRNILLTMLIGGLWHGAAWNFILWGGYFGVLLIAHRALISAWHAIAKRPRQKHQTEGHLRLLLKIFVLMQFNALGFLIFRVDSCSQLWEILSTINWTPSKFIEEQALVLLFFKHTAVLWLLDIVAYRKESNTAVLHWKLAYRVACYLLLFYSILWFGNFGGTEFVYFQF